MKGTQMWHTLLHIYGPVSIHSYGLMIAIGLIIFLYLIHRDPRFQALGLASRFNQILLIGIVAALIGGRLLFFISHPEFLTNPLDLITFWQGGFSILGTILAVLFTVPWYLKLVKIPIIPLLDLVAIYAPLLQSISRIGCLLAGCCYGIPTSRPWAIAYTDTGSIAPLYVCLHPTQLYSAISLLLIFSGMYFVLRHRFKKPGQLTCFYILFIGLERFIIDFWRGDRATSLLFSLNQYVAVGMVIGALIGFTYITIYHHRHHKS